MEIKMPREKFIESKVLGKYPHYFSTAIFFVDKNNKVSNGTITLLAGGNDSIIGLTCWHIIDEYMQGVEAGNQLSFYIGSLLINPLEILIDYDKKLDLATLRLNKKMQPSFKAKSYPDIGSLLISNIYQKEVEKEDIVTLGGLPGGWVEGLRFETFSIVNSRVYSAGAISFSCTVEDSNNWPVVQEEIYQVRTPKDLCAPGGLSGGAVFIQLTSSIGGLIYYELAGIIYEGNYIMGSSTLVLSICPARFVQFDGKIQRDFAASCNLDQR